MITIRAARLILLVWLTIHGDATLDVVLSIGVFVTYVNHVHSA